MAQLRKKWSAEHVHPIAHVIAATTSTYYPRYEEDLQTIIEFLEAKDIEYVIFRRTYPEPTYGLVDDATDDVTIAGATMIAGLDF